MLHNIGSLYIQAPTFRLINLDGSTESNLTAGNILSEKN